MSFAYTTVFGVLVMAAILQLSLQQDASPLAILRYGVNAGIASWHSRTSGSNNLVSEAEMRSDVAEEVREEYLNRLGSAGQEYPIRQFRVCWFDMSDTDRNGEWDEEERMQVFNDYAGEDRQLSLEEALRFGDAHWAIVVPCFNSMLRRIEARDRRQRTASGAN